MTDSAGFLPVTYHYVRDPGQYRYPGIHPVSQDQFGTEIDQLRERYYFPRLEEIEAFVLRDASLPRNSVFITFDDGLLDHWAATQNVLEPRGMTAVFFVPTRPMAESRALTVHKTHWLRAHTPPEQFVKDLMQYLDNRQRALLSDESFRERAVQMHIHDVPEISAIKFLMSFVLRPDDLDKIASEMLASHGIDDARFCEQTYMDRGMLRRLHESGHVVACHGHRHEPLSGMSDRDIDEDVGQNRAILEEALGEAPRWVSYPFGREDALPSDTRAVCARHGFSLGFTLLPIWNRNGCLPHSLGRISSSEIPKYL